MNKYSILRAAFYSAAGLGFAGAVMAARAYEHLKAESFETLGQAFMHVAPPDMMAVTAGISLTIGAAIEGISWYNRNLDKRRHGGKTPPATPKK